MYGHVIKHAPSYATRIDALWGTANIYEKGPLKNKKKETESLQQITEIPLEGILGEEESNKTRNGALARLELLKPSR